jgi:hypothetical protein
MAFDLPLPQPLYTPPPAVCTGLTCFLEHLANISLLGAVFPFWKKKKKKKK